MEILVNRPEVRVRVQSVAGYVVCIRCKGSKTVYVTDYYNHGSLYAGGVVSLQHEERCPCCSGRGYWKPL